jgi:serine/threonine-protein kinase
MDPKLFVQLTGLESTYDQIEKMATGGMAELYRARQKSLDRAVAIKKIRSEYREHPDLRARFKREARASANLLHHNLSHVYDYKEIDREAYIIMEYIDGFDLSHLIAKCAPLPADVALMIAVQVLIGLAYVHSHGMVHRDIKPENIRINTRGEIKIMDFGIAYDPSESNLTVPGMLVGSPHYLSPEQIIGSKIDGRSDLFSFGITFYEMLTGKKPFVEHGDRTIFQVIQSGEYTKIETFRSDLNPFVLRCAESCLEIDLAKRAESAHKLADSIQGFIIQNYSVSPESKIKQFLMQSGLMGSSSHHFEISEKTFDGYMIGSSKKNSKTFIFSVLFIVAALAAAFFFWKSRQKTVIEIEVPAMNSSKTH